MTTTNPPFQPVGSRLPFRELESGIRDFWRDQNIFRRSVDERPADNIFSFFEGPPTANGSPGVHHILARVFKDIFPRYKTMRGYRVPRKGGWDTHGLPVELEVERGTGNQLEAGDRGLRHRRIQREVPRVRHALRRAVGGHDRAHRLLDRHGRRLSHLQPRLRRNLLVDSEDAVGRRPRLRSTPHHSPLPPLRDLAQQPRTLARLRGRRRRPQHYDQVQGPAGLAAGVAPQLRG